MFFAGQLNPAVGFTAILTHDTYLGNKQAVKYDRIITNYGKGYNKWSGHFTASVKGLYVFSCTVMAKVAYDISIDIVKNGKSISTVYSNKHTWDQASETLVLRLGKGDKVWTRYAGSGRLLNGQYTLFSGYLISTKI